MNNMINTRTFPKSIVNSVTRARQLMDADISIHITISQLARASHTNEFTLKRFFKMIYRTTIYQHLLAERMRYANQLLSDGRLLEKDIARQCGFQRLSGFVSSYKKYYGITPGQFRALIFTKVPN